MLKGKNYFSKLVILLTFAIILASILSEIDARIFVLFIIPPTNGTLNFFRHSKVPFVDKLLKKIYIAF